MKTSSSECLETDLTHHASIAPPLVKRAKKHAYLDGRSSDRRAPEIQAAPLSYWPKVFLFLDCCYPTMCYTTV